MMKNALEALPTPQTREELKTAIDLSFAQITRLREQMEKDHVDIDRLKRETRDILDQLKAA